MTGLQTGGDHKWYGAALMRRWYQWLLFSVIREHGVLDVAPSHVYLENQDLDTSPKESLPEAHPERLGQHSFLAHRHLVTRRSHSL